MTDMTDDEFAELDVTEAEFDAMLLTGTPVEVVTLPVLAPETDVPYTIIRGPIPTYGSAPWTVLRPGLLTSTVSTVGAVAQTANLAA